MTDSSRSEAARFLRSLARFAAVAGAVWVVLFLLHAGLPGLRAGADRVYETKLDFLARGRLFDPAAEARVIVFGNSRVLAGFVPAVFDRELPLFSSSFNAGIPAATHFVAELEGLVERGETPTHVLLTSCWGTGAWREKLWDDERILERLFPFRRLARDASLFLLRSLRGGGPRAYYAEVEARLDRLLEDRGYHFIESQSHFPGHRLPDDYRTENDTPDRTRQRFCAPRGPLFERLLLLRERAGFVVALVPTYFRRNEVAEAPPNEAQRRELGAHGIEVLGPDYYRLPNRLFADHVHLNPEGAALYSTRLADLLAPLARRGGSSLKAGKDDRSANRAG